ncbi:hypothetical protein A3K73_08865 [Candidatus Pacearchaeota archaeon RBG_13_36_9]|nr:MAG: hypothetical protein A3K73_08865 [Candidatus Pacearchaeota archaeon RBG_13_36_9]HJX50355.1 Fic family protein [Candidatus Nanoarchaeia archaeon]
MVSKYDIFYVIATKGEIKISEIVKVLNKQKEDYQIVFNHVLELEKEGYIERDKTIRVNHNEGSKTLFRLISFCITNGINYNLMFKSSMLEFIEKAAKKEYFTIKDIKIHPQTYNFYIASLSKYGFLLILSRNPLKCKLLKHRFLIDLGDFFNNPIKFYAPKQKDLIPEIEKEAKKYKRNLKIHYSILEDLEKQEEVGFIYSSLNLEGNPLTLSDTQKLLLKEIVPEKYKLRDIQEVTNYKKAIDLMVSNAKKRVKLDLRLILKYHELAMSHIPEAGKIRKENVMIKGNPHFKTSEWQLINLRLNELMKSYDKFESENRSIKEVIDFAAFFHNEFQRIHPFIDGNSRTSRLLMLHILRSHDIPALELPLGYFDSYMNLTKLSKKRDDESFKYLIQEIVLFDIKRINARLG